MVAHGHVEGGREVAQLGEREQFAEPPAFLPVYRKHLIAGGLIAGLIVRRTGSLWLPIVVHICFDIPLYYAAACRLT